MKKILKSEVKGHEGLCKPTWLNKNQLDIRLYGLTGFFRNVKKFLCFYIKTGNEFHGIIKNGVVLSTNSTGVNNGKV